MNGKNPAMIPRQILTVRGIGDSESPYWTASSPDGNELLLEPDESVLFTGACRVSQISPKAWALPDTTKVECYSKPFQMILKEPFPKLA
jgi:hypothetical protein